MYYGSEEEAGMPLLIDAIIHFVGGTAATALCWPGLYLPLGVPYNAVLGANMAGGAAICALAMFQTLSRRKKSP